MPITDNNEEQVHHGVAIEHHQEVIADNNEGQVHHGVAIEHHQEVIAQPEAQQNHVQANYNGSTVQVIDKKTPIIFLFGPPSAGKTMTLVRLYRYFRDKGIKIEPNRSFVSGGKEGADYLINCGKFEKDANSDLAADATKGLRFMLLDIYEGTKKKCQILESPGEHLFHPDPDLDDFPNQYVSTIINSNNKKIYVFILEPQDKKNGKHWTHDSGIRARYKNRIDFVRTKMKPDKGDKVIFLYNKIDESTALGEYGKVDMDTLIANIEAEYPGIFNLFANKNALSRIWRKYNCRLIPFQTGDYEKRTEVTINKEVTIFTAGDNKYPQELWETIENLL
ncbi:MAG: hypothetical protein UH542_01415 [Bacteroidales bacterium]|nr:hypothetical protein [Bacteroidales bacterium]